VAASEPFAPAPVEALDLFVTLLSEVEAGEPADDFYSRLCEATCRLTSMRRAVIFLYDDDRRQVRAVGSHGVPLDLFAGAYLSPASAEAARRSLEEDRVVEVSELFEQELNERFLPLLEDGLLTGTPMSAGGRWYGVILADRAREGGPLTDQQRHTLWTLGKVCALAASARIATRQRERAQQLAERLDLAREVHDRVIQRLFGVSMALSAETLGGEARERCLAELQLAVGELRAAMQRAPERRPRDLRSLRDEVARLQTATPGSPSNSSPARTSRSHRPSSRSPSTSSTRRSQRPQAREADAHPRRADADRRAFRLEIVNDGVTGRREDRDGAAPGGVRSARARRHRRVRAHGEGLWRVRLTVPLEDES
jgi:GAF domain-containing protein